MAIWRAFNKKTNSYASPEIPNVLATVALAGVGTTSGSNIITVTSTTGVFPFMGLAIPSIPKGSFVLAVKSTTQIIAAAPLLNLTTGEWTVTEANANATATASGQTGHALGCNPEPIPSAIADGEMWRNTIGAGMKSTGLRIQTRSGVNFVYHDPGIMHGGVVPKDDATLETIMDGSSQLLIAADEIRIAVSDEFLQKPHRTKTKWRSVHYLVHTGGDVTTIPAGIDIAMVRIGADV